MLRSLSIMNMVEMDGLGKLQASPHRMERDLR